MLLFFKEIIVVNKEKLIELIELFDTRHTSVASEVDVQLVFDAITGMNFSRFWFDSSTEHLIPTYVAVIKERGFDPIRKDFDESNEYCLTVYFPNY